MKTITGGNVFTDPNRSGYAYEMTEVQTYTYFDHFDRLWFEEYDKLINSKKYERADLGEYAEMVDVLKKDISDDTKKWMVHQLRQQGIESTKKE